jgi:hypothetical protein
MRLYERFSRHPWALEVTVGVGPIGPNEVAWLEEVAAALAGTALTGAETLDVAAAWSVRCGWSLSRRRRSAQIHRSRR